MPSPFHRKPKTENRKPAAPEGLPLVAIIGRANVGKSTLFNRLTRSSQALVADLAGVTRDRHYGSVTFDDRTFLLVDTGGLVGGEEEIGRPGAPPGRGGGGRGRRHPPGDRWPGRPPGRRRPGGGLSAPHRQDLAPGGEQDRPSGVGGQPGGFLPLRFGPRLPRLRHPGLWPQRPAGGHSPATCPPSRNCPPRPRASGWRSWAGPMSANLPSSIASWARNVSW